MNCGYAYIKVVFVLRSAVDCMRQSFIQASDMRVLKLVGYEHCV